LSAGDVCEDGKIMGLWKWSKSHPTTEGLLADALEHLAYAGHEEKAAELYDQFIAMCKK
jgi:hypothetical protein